MAKKNANEKLLTWLGSSKKEGIPKKTQKTIECTQGKKCSTCMYKDKVKDGSCEVLNLVGCPQIIKNPSRQFVNAVLESYEK